MRVHVVHLLAGDAGAGERRLDHLDHAQRLRVRRGHVVGVVGDAVAGDLAVDAGAAGARVLELLDHHRGGALGEDEPAPGEVERP